MPGPIMDDPEKIDPIRKGLKFNSRSFKDEAEISAIRESANQLDVIMIPSDGHAWEEKNWNLKEFRELFKKNYYTEIKPNPTNISVW